MNYMYSFPKVESVHRWNCRNHVWRVTFY